MVNNSRLVGHKLCLGSTLRKSCRDIYLILGRTRSIWGTGGTKIISLVQSNSYFLFSIRVFFFRDLHTTRNIRLTRRSFSLFTIITRFEQRNRTFTRYFMELFVVSRSKTIHHGLRRGPLNGINVGQFRMRAIGMTKGQRTMKTRVHSPFFRFFTILRTRDRIISTTRALLHLARHDIILRSRTTTISTLTRFRRVYFTS